MRGDGPRNRDYRPVVAGKSRKARRLWRNLWRRTWGDCRVYFPDERSEGAW